MAHVTFTCPVQDVGADDVKTILTASDDNTIPAALADGSSDTTLTGIRFNYTLSGLVQQLMLNVGGGGFGTAGDGDLSTTFETGGSLQIIQDTRDYRFSIADDAEGEDDDEPYIWSIAPGSRAAFNAFRTALNSSSEIEVTIWDGQGSNPFRDLIASVEIEAKKTLPTLSPRIKVDTQVPPAILQNIELLEGWYDIQTFGFRWTPPAADRPQLETGLQADANPRYFGNITVRRDRAGAVFHFEDSRSSNLLGNKDLSATFESEGILTITVGGNSFDFPVGPSGDTAEPYRIDFSGDDADAFLQWRADNFPSTGLLSGELTIRDKAGDPYNIEALKMLAGLSYTANVTRRAFGVRASREYGDGTGAVSVTKKAPSSFHLNASREYGGITRTVNVTAALPPGYITAKRRYAIGAQRQSATAEVRRVSLIIRFSGRTYGGITRTVAVKVYTPPNFFVDGRRTYSVAAARRKRQAFLSKRIKGEAYRLALAGDGATVPILLVEISHPVFTVPARVARSTTDVVHRSKTYSAVAFDVEFPTQYENRRPKARLQMDRYSDALIEALEDATGARDAEIRFIQVLESSPDTVEAELTMKVASMFWDTERIQAELEFKEPLDIPFCAFRFTNETAPGLF